MADDDGADWEADNRRDASSDSDDEKYRRRRSPSQQREDDAKAKGNSSGAAGDARRGGKGQRPVSPSRRAPPWRLTPPVKGGPGKGGIRLPAAPLRGKGGARPPHLVGPVTRPVGRLVPLGKGRIPIRAPVLSRYGHPYPGVYTMRAAPRPYMSLIPPGGARPMPRTLHRPLVAPRPYLVPLRRGPVGSRPQAFRPALTAPTIARAGAGRRPMIMPKITGRQDGAPIRPALTMPRRLVPPRAAAVQRVIKPVPRLWRGAALRSGGASSASSASRAHPAGLRPPSTSAIVAVKPKAPPKLLRPTIPPRTRERRGSPLRRTQSKAKASTAQLSLKDKKASRSRSRSQTRRVSYRSRSRGRGDTRRSNADAQAPRSSRDSHGRRGNERKSRSRSRSRHRTVMMSNSMLADEAVLGKLRESKEQEKENAQRTKDRPLSQSAPSKIVRNTTEASSLHHIDHRKTEVVADSSSRARPAEAEAKEVPLEQKISDLVSKAQEPVRRRSPQRSSDREARRTSVQGSSAERSEREKSLREKLLKNLKDKDKKRPKERTSSRRAASVSSESSSSTRSRRRHRKSRSRRRQKEKKASGRKSEPRRR